MSRDFFIYKPRPNETFTTIAKRLGMDPIKLRSFHNKRVRYDEIAFFDSITRTSFVYIPKAMPTEALKNKELNQLVPTPKTFAQFYAPTYFVTEVINAPEEAPLVITYFLDLTFTPYAHATHTYCKTKKV